jgi:hypothetical protein
VTLTAQAPSTDAESTNLFPEAKRRRRRRRIVLAAIITPLGVAVGVSLAQGGSPPKEPPLVSRPGDDGSSLPATGHWVAQGNGIGQARFGQTRKRRHYQPREGARGSTRQGTASVP